MQRRRRSIIISNLSTQPRLNKINLSILLQPDEEKKKKKKKSCKAQIHSFTPPIFAGKI